MTTPREKAAEILGHQEAADGATVSSPTPALTVARLKEAIESLPDDVVVSIDYGEVCWIDAVEAVVEEYAQPCQIHRCGGPKKHYHPRLRIA